MNEDRPASTSVVRPAFPPSYSVDRRTYAVDTNHIGWWIDPDTKTITRAEDTE